MKNAIDFLIFWSLFFGLSTSIFRLGIEEMKQDYPHLYTPNGELNNGTR
jgi:hypothetical protein